MTDMPILWSFRRCPYAMRARLAIRAARMPVELREILLRDKPEAFLKTSPSATVPTLRLPDRVIDESRDIMIWALEQQDPSGVLEMPEEAHALIDTCDGPFKAALDHTKYATRYPDKDPAIERANAAVFLSELNHRLNGQHHLFGDRQTLADLAILPFIRQFAHIDRAWFDAQEWPHLIGWLDRFLASEAFVQIMGKYAPWTPGDTPVRCGT